MNGTPLFAFGMDGPGLVLLGVMIVFYLGIPAGLLWLVLRSREATAESDDAH